MCGGAGMPCACNPDADLQPGAKIICAVTGSNTKIYKPKFDA